MAKRRTAQDRRGLKTPPLRNPGQSTEERYRDLWEDKILFPFITSLFFIVMTAYLWISWCFSWPEPTVRWVFTLYSVTGCGVFLWRFKARRDELRDYKLGRDGERLVGQTLESLRSMNYRVIHDIPANGFNVDHVIVGPSGVYAIETKTRTKDTGYTIRVEGNRIFKNDVLLEGDNDPRQQAWASARHIKDLVQQGTSTRVYVHPVVLFPEWYVEEDPQRDHAWVLNPKRLPLLLESQPIILTPQEISLIASALETHVRSWNGNS